MNNETPSAPLPAEFDALLAFVPFMEARQAGHWAGGERMADGSISMPWFEYDPAVLAFIKACVANCWVVSFDWQPWLPAAVKYSEDSDALTAADVETLRKLLTLHIRRDRFFEGHLANMIETGHVAAILRRLAELREPA